MKEIEIKNLNFKDRKIQESVETEISPEIELIDESCKDIHVLVIEYSKFKAKAFLENFQETTEDNKQRFINITTDSTDRNFKMLKNLFGQDENKSDKKGKYEYIYYNILQMLRFFSHIYDLTDNLYLRDEIDAYFYSIKSFKLVEIFADGIDDVRKIIGVKDLPDVIDISKPCQPEKMEVKNSLTSLRYYPEVNTDKPNNSSTPRRQDMRQNMSLTMHPPYSHKR
ncbi:MAG: hypothetical protein EBS92_06990 [Proteobacteria bacterium]|nr:hypothetical protein [Pseudomonadota bacterium]